MPKVPALKPVFAFSGVPPSAPPPAPARLSMYLAEGNAALDSVLKQLTELVVRLGVEVPPQTADEGPTGSAIAAAARIRNLAGTIEALLGQTLEQV